MYRMICRTSLVAFVAACSQTNHPGTAARSDVAVGLQPLSTCIELDDLLRDKARAEMNKSLDDAIAALKTGDTNNCYLYESAMAPSGGVAVTNAGGDGSSASSSPSSVSETNNQVAGVDEADLVKTDGKNIYLAQGSEFRIVSAWPASETKIAARVTLEGNAKKLFVVGNRALVYVSKSRATVATNAAWMATSAADCSYGYSCDFSGDGTATQLLLFDISVATNPIVLRKIDMPGSLIAARRIGTTVHTVASIGDLRVPDLESYGSFCGGALSGDALETELDKVEQIRARNNAKIDTATFDVGTLAREGTTVLGKLDCSDFYREVTTDGMGITTVMSLDLAESEQPVLANVLSRAGAVYASATSLYMAVPHRKGNGFGWYDSIAADEASTIHHFNIGTDPAATAYLASGIVPGHVLNQFAMDEYADVLRIATSKGAVPDPKVESVLSVLQRHGASLDTIGQLGGIAPTEDIRSVRFEAERGYVVTFKKTDPLFVLDLSNPVQPRITGELKIPGFSTYMHPLDGGHLLALGYEADDQGSFAYFNGIQLQIFDVSTITEPRLLHKKVYGTRGSSSSALTDHLGFTFLPQRGLLTLPISICEGGGNGQFGTLDFSGVVALNVKTDAGFVELGRLEEPYPTNQSSFRYGGACADWWTDSNSVVRRTVVMDDFLYAISDNRLRVQNLNALGIDVKLLDFAP